MGVRKDPLLVDLRHDLVDSFLRRFVVAIYKSVSVSVQAFRSQLLLLARGDDRRRAGASFG